MLNVYIAIPLLPSLALSLYPEILPSPVGIFLFIPCRSLCLAIALTIYRGHWGLSAWSPKKSLEKGSQAQKVRKESKTRLKTWKKLGKWIILWLFGPPGPRGPGNPFRDFFLDFGPKGQNDPWKWPTISQFLPQIIEKMMAVLSVDLGWVHAWGAERHRRVLRRRFSDSKKGFAEVFRRRSSDVLQWLGRGEQHTRVPRRGFPEGA